MEFNKIQSVDIKNKTVLLRADLNVPRKGDEVTDTTRIDRLKHTISYLQAQNAKVVVLSHFGRPEGEIRPDLSLKFMVPALEKSWGTKVRFVEDCVGTVAKEAVQNAKLGDILLLENVRFHKGEKNNDSSFSEELASLGEVFVTDAFSTAHRAHASTVGVANYLPSVAGFLMEEELSALTMALEKPARPLMAIAAGSKISTKLEVLDNLITKVDYLVLGGGMANTFLYAQGLSLGKSLCETDMVETAKEILKKAETVRCEIILPQDAVVASEIKENIEHQVVDIKNISADLMAIDIGPKTVEYIIEKVKNSRTVVWNGPVGVFEVKPFDHGTNQLAQAIAYHTMTDGCTSIAGGGDTVAALENAGVTGSFSYISTAGGAFLEWLEGKNLPGVEAVCKK